MTDHGDKRDDSPEADAARRALAAFLKRLARMVVGDLPSPPGGARPDERPPPDE